MTDNRTDEIDLGIIFTKIKDWFNSIVLNIYHFIQFVIKNWWIILIVGVLGYVAGYFIEQKSHTPKSATIIVQNNFKSSSYVYGAIEQLNNKIGEGDYAYLEENGINNPDNIVFFKVEPIVNLLEVMEKTIYNYRALEPLLEKADFEDELLTSEVFQPEYSYHKITLVTNHKGKDEAIKNLITYLNNNDLYNEIRKVVIEDTKQHIAEFEKSIQDINVVMESFAKDSTEIVNPNQIVLSTANASVDLGALLGVKMNILNQKEKFKIELLKYDNVVTVMNNPTLQEMEKFIEFNEKNTAILFILGFLLVVFLRRKFLQVKKMAEKNP